MSSSLRRSCFARKSPCNVLARCIAQLEDAVGAQLLKLLREAGLREHLQTLKGQKL